MGQLRSFAVSRGWTCFVLWTIGAALRWTAGVVEWHWRILLPLSGLLELAGFLLFFYTVSGHRAGTTEPRRQRETWMLLVIASVVGFLTSLVLNAGESLHIAWTGSEPAFPHVFDQQLIALETWCFLVVAIWGFNARWLPVFLGLQPPNGRILLAALGLAWAAMGAQFCGAPMVSAWLILAAAVTASIALHIWQKPLRPAKIEGVHRSFLFFIRAARMRGS